MEKYVQDVRIKQWSEIIEAANSSPLPRREWLKANGISKDAFYYWQRKVRKAYAEEKGLVPRSSGAGSSSLVEIPVIRERTNAPLQTAAAVIRVGGITVEVSSLASAEFMENLGRMIRNAL